MKICLSMIVKNEAKTLIRCLPSVKNFISHYVISDTGSTDNTKELIPKLLEGISGEVISNEWVDYATNRNYALEKCKDVDCDWIMTIDADEIFNGPPLELDPAVDAYHVLNNNPGCHHYRLRIFKNDGNWKYKYVVHEVLMSEKAGAITRKLKNNFISDFGDGCRTSTGCKFYYDAAMIKKALQTEPNDTRYNFYLGQSYKDMGWWDAAVNAYQRRIELGGWEEEVYLSMHYKAMCKFYGCDNILECAEDFVAAWKYRPSRLEALLFLCEQLNKKRFFNLSYVLSKDKRIKNEDILFVNEKAEWKLLEEHGVACYWIGLRKEAQKCFETVLNEFNISQMDQDRVKKNLMFCL